MENKMNSNNSDKETLNKQQGHWENKFSKILNMFGEFPSDAALKAADLFKKEGKTNILELGGGQGRDTFFFAKNKFHIQVLDYSLSGIATISQKAEQMGLSQYIRSMQHDIRKPFPFDDNSFDACFSHMLYCMALTTSELEFLSNEIRRVLKTEGFNVYTVRNTEDAHYGTGIHRGEDMYEVNGFIVHFFSKKMVEHLASGFEIVDISEFEEGDLPRKLFRVTLKKT